MSLGLLEFVLLLWSCFDLFLKTLVFSFQGWECDESLVLPATAGQWVWLGDSSSEPCTPVLPSIKLRLCLARCVACSWVPFFFLFWSLFVYFDFLIHLNLLLSDV